MTPSTPPLASESRNEGSRRPTGFDNEFQERETGLLETPKKYSQQDGPVTPSTGRPFKGSIPLLAPNSELDLPKSPFRGFLSPEYTPNRGSSSGKRRPLQFEQPKSLKGISRVLFPQSEDESDIQRPDEQMFQTKAELLPSAKTLSIRRKLSNDFKVVSDEEIEKSFKHSKQEPGTPSHKIVTYEMAENWHNPKVSDDTEGTDDESLIFSSEPQNPFISQEVPDKKTRERRKKALLEENPDIEDVVTYLDKRGNVVRKVSLSEEAKEAYKPKILFEKELEEIEYNQSNRDINLREK